MRIVKSIDGIRALVREARAAGETIGFVPTMGALHAGHAALIDQARAGADFLIVSIFVNPLQFDREDDYQRYAKNLPADAALCESRGVDAIFAPEAAEMYPGSQRTHVDVERVTDRLCGQFRPGHFRGVSTVVTKLFNIVQPDKAYFGEKDAQQLAVVRRMAADLNMPVEIVPVPTVREADGLALSSRNVRLTAEERRAAPALYRALLAVANAIEGGACDPERAKAEGLAVLAGEPLIRSEYLEIVDVEDMQPVASVRGPVLVAGAAWVGSTRLIDNVRIEPIAGSQPAGAAVGDTMIRRGFRNQTSTSNEV
ncbi:MAG TPA: pantoate--beta-alanine ligase [Bryobacteraceae bacterium]|nr:pantoate--beta-alanine ligase [Bryobacteraceae bacterium]